MRHELSEEFERIDRVLAIIQWIAIGVFCLGCIAFLLGAVGLIFLLIGALATA